MNGTVGVQSNIPVKRAIPAAKKTNGSEKENSGDSFRDLVSQAEKDKETSSDKNIKTGEDSKREAKPAEKEESGPVNPAVQTEGADSKITAQLAAQSMEEAMQIPISTAEDVMAAFSQANSGSQEAGLFTGGTAAQNLDGKLPAQPGTSENQLLTPQGSGTGTDLADQGQLIKEGQREITHNPAKFSSQTAAVGGYHSQNQAKAEAQTTPGAELATAKPLQEESASQNGIWKSAAVGTASEDKNSKTLQKELPTMDEAMGREALAKANQGQTVRVKVAEPYQGVNREFSNQVSQYIAKNMGVGQNEFEIQLEPEQLGKIIIKIALSEDGAKVVLNSSNARTLGLLSENARSIGAIVENNTGQQTQVEVKQPEFDYLNQQRDQSDRQQGRQDEGREQNGQRNRAAENETADFMQQLRLGLVGL